MSEPRARIIGAGCHPDHLTPEAARALAGCDYVLAFDKGGSRGSGGSGGSDGDATDDPLLAFRREVCDQAGVELVVLPDPPRERDDPADYARAVRDWHTARARAYARAMRERGGTAGFLVWGDPALYDSTIRVVAATGIEYAVVPGVSAPTLLAARHGIVLHEVGRPVLVTTGRRLAEDVVAGHDNLVVMLDGRLACADLAAQTGAWQLWWGANLATGSERLVAGDLAEVLDRVRAERESARAEAGWVMDTYLLRRGSAGDGPASAVGAGVASDRPGAGGTA